MSASAVLAPDASCKTFDVAANGYARVEAITAIYVKPVTDALRDGNPIRAIVKATSLNFDGKSTSLIVPNGVAHEALMRKAYHDVGLDPKDTSFLEVSHPHLTCLKDSLTKPVSRNRHTYRGPH
jgi:acyl transferase domain-containing protein